MERRRGWRGRLAAAALGAALPGAVPWGAAGRGVAAEGAPVFPGGPALPAGAATAPELVAALYGARGGPPALQVPGSASCGSAPCRVRLLREAGWAGADGYERRLLVTVAEPAGPGRAAPLVGVALLGRRPAGWVLIAGTPVLTGDDPADPPAVPEATVVEAGPLGPGLALETLDCGGERCAGRWTLYLAGGGTFRQVLSATTREPGQALEYRMTTAPAPDGSLRIERRISSRASGRPAGRWLVDPDGQVKLVP